MKHFLMDFLSKPDGILALAWSGWTISLFSKTPALLYIILSAFIGCFISAYVAKNGKEWLSITWISLIAGSLLGWISFLIAPYTGCMIAGISSLSINSYFFFKHVEQN